MRNERKDLLGLVEGGGEKGTADIAEVLALGEQLGVELDDSAGPRARKILGETRLNLAHGLTRVKAAENGELKGLFDIGKELLQVDAKHAPNRVVSQVSELAGELQDVSGVAEIGR